MVKSIHPPCPVPFPKRSKPRWGCLPFRGYLKIFGADYVYLLHAGWLTSKLGFQRYWVKFSVAKSKLGSDHKRPISNPPTPLPPMFKTAKFQICQRCYQPNLPFDFGGYDYWRLWILAGTALADLKFGVCGCRPVNLWTPFKPGEIILWLILALYSSIRDGFCWVIWARLINETGSRNLAPRVGLPGCQIEISNISTGQAVDQHLKIYYMLFLSSVRSDQKSDV